jgi:hypothetical protein
LAISAAAERSSEGKKFVFTAIPHRDASRVELPHPELFECGRNAAPIS